MDTYRDEQLDISAFDEAEAMALAERFNAHIQKRDAYAYIEGSALHFMLKQLDMDKYEAMLAALAVSDALKKAAYCVIDRIGSYGIKESKRIFSGFNDERKVKNRKSKEQDRRKHYYANSHGFSRVNNDLPADYENRIVCADSLELLKKLPDNCVDIIVTSPPYNFGLDYGAHNDTSHWDAYYATLFQIFDACIRVLKYGGRFVVNVQPLYSDYIPSHHIISNFFLSRKMIWKGEILWEKNNYNCKYCSWGSWKSPASPYLKYTWEFIEVFCKGELKKEGEKRNADITEDEFKSWVVAKWSIAPERRMKEFGHPAMFPEQLVERALKLFSFQNDVVLDPFNGAGTTTVVAKRLHRRFLGVDSSPIYCQTARERLETVTDGQLTLFDS